VRADYVFHNGSDRPVAALAVFEMPDVQGPYTNIDAGNPASDNFLGYAATQDGIKVKPALQRRIYSSSVDMTDLVAAAKVPFNPLSEAAHKALGKLPQKTLDDWVSRGLIVEDTSEAGDAGKKAYAPAWTMKSVYFWKVTFPPGKDVHISQSHINSVGSTVANPFGVGGAPDEATIKPFRDRYCVTDAFLAEARKAVDGGAAYNPSWTSYSLSGASEWSTVINRLTVTVEKPDADSLVSFCGTGIKQTSPTTYEMTLTDYVPDKRLDILFMEPAQAP
jgi:hypothetical protein